MRLYSGTSKQFIQDVTQNQITEKLKQAFFEHFFYNPPHSEVNSWRNSLRAISIIIEYSKLTDNGILLEYQLPLTSKRLDCLICGKDETKKENAVIIELKQWEKCKEIEESDKVLTWTGGGEREVLHPSVQVGQYKTYLEDMHTAFHIESNPINLNACAYLHNYNFYSEDPIFSKKFNDWLKKCPLFTADDVDRFRDYLVEKLKQGEGMNILKKIEESKYRPSKKLMDHVGNVVKHKLKNKDKDIKILGGDYILLDEQLVAYDKVVSQVKKGFHDKQKNVIIIKGGPGTGKSVIALKLLSDLSVDHYNTQYATGSQSFTKTLRKIVGTRAAIQFKYFLSYSDAESNAVDVLIMDEAHRIREKTVMRYKKSSGNLQLEELINAAKVCVFFIDDKQVVRPDEIGSSNYIKGYAEKNNCKISEYKLETQFRCGGSNTFINWINNTLGIERTVNVLWDNKENFDFKIFDSPESLEDAIKEKVKQDYTGRVSAGFCWKWSLPKEDGTLLDDVVIGNFKRPWDAKPNAKKLAKNIPEACYWAYDPNGINQIGCIYTAQGFEFDYIGVIFGKDLVYNFDKQSWEGHKEESADAIVKRSEDNFINLVKNTYRVLLTRGIKGCYVYFLDKDTERFFRSRIEK